jgi:hypothetical protein
MTVGTKNEPRRKTILRSRIFLNSFIFALLTNFQQPLIRGANVSNTRPSIFLSSSSQNFPNSFAAASMNPHYSLAVSDISFLMAELDIWRCFEKGCWDPDLRRPGEFGAFFIWLRNTKSTRKRYCIQMGPRNLIGEYGRLVLQAVISISRDLLWIGIFPETFELLQTAQKLLNCSPNKNELWWCEASTIAVRRIEDNNSILLWQA